MKSGPGAVPYVPAAGELVRVTAVGPILSENNRSRASRFLGMLAVVLDLRDERLDGRSTIAVRVDFVPRQDPIANFDWTLYLGAGSELAPAEPELRAAYALGGLAALAGAV